MKIINNDQSGALEKVSDKTPHHGNGILETIYYFDKIRIIVKERPDRLSNILPLKELRKYCRDINIYAYKDSDKAFRYGFLSAIDVVVVKNLDFFRVLGEYAEFLTGYKISYIEIAGDSIYETQQETLVVFENILKHTLKNYSHDFKIYDATEADFEDETIGKLINRKNVGDTEYLEEKYSKKTGYWGTDRQKLVIYPRLSKIAGKPSVHKEWRIRGAGNIKKKTNIDNIQDFIDFNFNTYFMKNEERYIRHMQIDHRRHGRFLLGINNKTNTVTQYLNGRLLIDRAARASHLFCRANEIIASAELKYFYKKEFELVRKKGRGRRTIWEEKVGKLTSAKVRGFVHIYNNV